MAWFRFSFVKIVLEYLIVSDSHYYIILNNNNVRNYLDMKSLRNLFLSLALASSLGAVSTSALAADPGRIIYDPAQAIDLTVEKTRAAIATIDNGAEGEEAANAIKEAIDMNKEINANDVVDRNRQKAASHLKKARRAAKKEEMQPAEEHLRKALKGYESLKSML